MPPPKLTLSALNASPQASVPVPPRPATQPTKERQITEFVDAGGNLIFNGKSLVTLSSRGATFTSATDEAVNKKKSYEIDIKQLKVMEELGRGQFGLVNKVLHEPTQVVMAMKQIRLEISDSACRQILMELEVLHRARSPYIIDFYGAFFVEGSVHLCMEFMDGGSVDRLYGAGGVGELILSYLALSVTRGLQFLKDQLGVIHRDVKPTNVLINSKAQVKLCDFGVSGQLVQSMAKTHIGSQSYMSPERITTADAAYSVSADVWSLGMTLWECAEGQYPFPASKYDSVFAQLSAIVQDQPAPLSSEKYSYEAQSFVQSCLIRDPKQRPSYQQLLEMKFLQDIALKLENEKGAKIVECVKQWVITTMKR